MEALDNPSLPCKTFFFTANSTALYGFVNVTARKTHMFMGEQIGSLDAKCYYVYSYIVRVNVLFYNMGCV